MPGKLAFIRLMALFMCITILGFIIGYSYSVETSKTYTSGPGKEAVSVKK